METHKLKTRNSTKSSENSVSPENPDNFSLDKNFTKKSFIERDKLYNIIENAEKEYSTKNLELILKKSLKLKGLSVDEAAILLMAKSKKDIDRILDVSSIVKQAIYGKRLVLFAPLYLANYCSNNCLYCAFRKDNKKIKRAKLNDEQIKLEVKSLLRQGHKRILLLTGESEATSLEYFLNAIDIAYSVRENGSNIRRINVEIAPLTVDEFQKLEEKKIGTYVCFQETYDEVLYKNYHPTGPKSDYLNRLFVMDRAMEAGIKDVGIGALFGLAPYKFEVLALIEHANHLEDRFGTGCHTVSIPRIEKALGAPLSSHVPYPVSDEDFSKLLGILRLALPYTGIILSTRENENFRQKLFKYGVSQISAGSRTNPGAYATDDKEEEENSSQFSLGDHRTLHQVISSLVDDGYIPSFCTGCYRKGRVGQDFMDLAKPGLIQKYCMPNGLTSFMEYLLDFADNELKTKGFLLIDNLVNEIEDPELQKLIIKNLESVKSGERDVYI
ncbi:MAG TPA: [FeFe] hydrogenase H-cluster radical SAM maturase HydG [Exilispira sp.]|nr:[FeFe] hydrogenase H-cluster radical SAM maturase HydG [Exilispira sp.]